MIISEKEHPELARSLNSMTTLLSREHSEREWKVALLRVMYCMAVEIISKEIPITASAKTMKDILDRLNDGKIHRQYGGDPNIHPCDTKPLGLVSEYAGTPFGRGEISLEETNDFGHLKGSTAGCDCNNPGPNCLKCGT